jgi:hypothetical protein
MTRPGDTLYAISMDGQSRAYVREETGWDEMARCRTMRPGYSTLIVSASGESENQGHPRRNGVTRANGWKKVSR